MGSYRENHTKVGMNLEVLCAGGAAREVGRGVRHTAARGGRSCRLTEHLIRLRGGWTSRAAGAPDSEERRLDLPVGGGPLGPGRLILTRRFGRPPLTGERQFWLLRMDKVAGIRSATLNGQPLVLASGGATQYEISLPGLAERNVLVLEIETGEIGARPRDAELEWGLIALVVRTIASGDEPSKMQPPDS
jgi:hypothetical protein